MYFKELGLSYLQNGNLVMKEIIHVFFSRCVVEKSGYSKLNVDVLVINYYRVPNCSTFADFVEKEEILIPLMWDNVRMICG